MLVIIFVVKYLSEIASFFCMSIQYPIKKIKANYLISNSIPNIQIEAFDNLFFLVIMNFQWINNIYLKKLFVIRK